MYIREEDLILELLKILDKVNINELGMRKKLEDKIARFNIFQRSVLGATEKIKTDQETDIRNYAKYILKEGPTVEKRELLANLRSRIMYKDKKLTLIEAQVKKNLGIRGFILVIIRSVRVQPFFCSGHLKRSAYSFLIRLPHNTYAEHRLELLSHDDYTTEVLRKCVHFLDLQECV